MGVGGPGRGGQLEVGGGGRGRGYGVSGLGRHHFQHRQGAVCAPGSPGRAPTGPQATPTLSQTHPIPTLPPQPQPPLRLSPLRSTSAGPTSGPSSCWPSPPSSGRVWSPSSSWPACRPPHPGPPSRSLASSVSPSASPSALPSITREIQGDMEGFRGFRDGKGPVRVLWWGVGPPVAVPAHCYATTPAARSARSSFLLHTRG